MQRLVSVFSALDPMRRLLVLAAVAGTFFAVLSLARVASTPSMALLYSGLDSAAAGEVIQSLEQMGAVYDVREQAIFVDASRRDMLRMALAAEGKPAATNAGYEILDGLSGFGTTAQMFDAAYWRAKEGELARTIVSNPQVRSARVHISKTPTRTFGNDTPGAASVVVSTASGGVKASHAKALKFLISSAVPGLTPEQVSVIDADGGLVASGDESADPVLAAGDRAASLKANVERLLEARVGYGKAVVEINLDTVTEREQIVERTLDPDSRVAISTVTEETTSSAQDARGGEVTVAGNLPDGDANGSGGNSSSSDSGTREQVNYEISETQREIVRAPGAIRRLSVAVLIDGLRTVADDGTETWAPRSEEELSALRELVASAVGFDESRGDTLTLRTMEFLPVEPAGTEVSAPSLLEQFAFDPVKMVQLGVLALVSLILGLFVVRPILTAPPVSAPPPSLAPPPLQEGSEQTGIAQDNQPEALSGELDDGEFLPDMAVISDAGADVIAGAPDMQLGGGSPLKQLIDGRQDETATVLKQWMEDGTEAA